MEKRAFDQAAALTLSIEMSLAAFGSMPYKGFLYIDAEELDEKSL